MPEEQDVTQESSPETEEQVVNENVPESDQQEQTVESQSEVSETPSAEVTAVPSDYDEMGVPYKNRYHEMKRKYEDISSKQDQILAKVDTLQATQQQPKYSKEQLMEFIAKDDTEPSHRAWALSEMDKLEEAKLTKTIEEKFQSLQEKQQAERAKADTFNFVVQRHPDLILKDNAGNFAGWNTKSPVVQRMDAYMRNPEIANNPHGLRVALALAKDDLSGNQVANQQKLKTQVKNLQKGTLVEGGGKPTQVSKTPLRKAIEEARKGDMKSGTEAMRQVLRAQGVIKE